LAQRTFPLFVPITAFDRFTAPLGRMGGALEGFGRKAERAGRKLTVGLTVPLAALGALSVKTGLEYQRALNRVQATTGATAAEVEALAASADATLGAAGIPSSARKTAVAMAELARGGRSLAEVQGALPGVVALATAALVDEATAAKATTDVLDAYGLRTEEAGRVTDILAFAANRGEQEFAALVEGLAGAGQSARETGQDLESTAAILNVLADAHFEGAAGAALFKKAVGALQRPSGETSRTLLRLGLTSRDLFRDDGQLRNLDEILETLNLHGADARDAIGLFGAKAGLSLAALLGPGTAKVRAFVEELRGAGGAAGDLARVQLGGGVGVLEEFQGKWERFLITVARSGLLEALGALATKLGAVIDRFRTLPQPVRTTVVALGIAAAALGPFLVGMGNVLQVGGKLLGLFRFMGPAARAVGTALPRVLPRALSMARGLPLGGLLAGAAFKQGTSAPEGSVRAAIGRTLGTKRLDAAAQGAPATGRTDVSGSVQIEFRNAPAGTRVRARQTGDVPLEVDTGYVLAGGLAG